MAAFGFDHRRLSMPDRQATHAEAGARPDHGVSRIAARRVRPRPRGADQADVVFPQQRQGAAQRAEVVDDLDSRQAQVMAHRLGGKRPGVVGDLDEVAGHRRSDGEHAAQQLGFDAGLFEIAAGRRRQRCEIRRQVLLQGQDPRPARVCRQGQPEAGMGSSDIGQQCRTVSSAHHDLLLQRLVEELCSDHAIHI